MVTRHSKYIPNRNTVSQSIQHSTSRKARKTTSFKRPGRYESLESRVWRAQKFIRQIHSDIRNLLIDVNRGEPLDRNALFSIADDLALEMSFNSEAMLYCCRHKRVEDYTSLRCISFSALLYNFARFVGFSQSRLRR
ncbi:MAG: hypothetical protein R3240_10175, partial [Gammaproteobacteria bacterium]|nr:hypothetical protein [Gammaproteobacteria bacterium]